MTRNKRMKRRLLIVGSAFGLLVIAMAALVIVRSSSKGLRLNEAREEGLAAYAERDYEGALRPLSYYLSHNRNDLEALVAFADSRSRVPTENNRHIMEAIRLYNHALALDSNHLEALKGILPLYERARRQIEWMDVAQRILAQEPDNVDALRLRAMGHYLDQDYERTREYTHRLIELEPADMRWRSLELQIMRDQDAPLEEILAICENWIDNFEGDGRFHLLKAQALATAGQRQEAATILEEAAMRGADEHDVLQQMVSLLSALQKRQTARQVIAATRERFPDELWPYEASVRSYWQANEHAEALREIEVAEAELGELNSGLLRWKCLLLILKGEVDEAERTLGALAEAGDEESDRVQTLNRAWVGALRATLDQESLTSAEVLRAYIRAVSLAPMDPVLQFFLGQKYLQLGEHELAMSALRQSYQSDPNWIAAHLAYVETMLYVGQAHRALQVVYDALQRTENPSASLHLLFARAWLAADQPHENIGLMDARTGRPVGLVTLLQRIYDLMPDSREACELLVAAALRYNQPEVARRAIEQTIDEDSDNVPLLLSLAHFSASAEFDLEDALLQQARRHAPDSLEIADFEARLLFDRGRAEEGLSHLKAAIQRQPREKADAPATLMKLAAFHSLMENKEAIGIMERLLSLPEASHETALFVISQSVAWKDKSLVRRAIDLLASIVGEDSQRVIMANGNYVLRYTPDDEAALAQSQLALNEMLQRAPESLSARRLMVQLAMAGDTPDTRLAIRHLTQAVTRHPGAADLYVQLIRLLQSIGDFTQAETYLRQFGDLSRHDPRLRRAEAELLERQGDFEQALARMLESVDDATEESEKLLLVTRMLRAGQHDAAGELVESILQSPAPSELAITIAADYFAVIGDMERGARLLRDFEPEGGEVQKAMMLGRYFQSNGRMQEARAEFERALSIEPRNVEAITHLANLMIAIEDHAAAFDLASRGLEYDPANTSLQTALMLSSFSAGPAERERAKRLLATSGQFSGPLLDTIRVFEQLNALPPGQPPSRTTLNEARRLTVEHPEFMPAWRLAIVAFVQADQHDEAIRLAQQATSRLPHLAEPAELATQLMLQQNRLDDALLMAETWRRRSLQNPLVPDVAISSIHVGQGRPHQAALKLEPHASRILAQREQFPERAVLWMEALLRSEQVDRAFAQFRGLMSEDRYWIQGWIELSRNLPLQQAKQALNMVESELDHDPELLLYLAAAWQQLGNYSSDSSSLRRAGELARRAVEEDADLRVPAATIRAQAAESAGDEDAAESYYRQAIGIDPDNVVALNNLAYLLARTGRKCDDAVSLAQRAKSLAPDVPEILDTLAQALLCAGDVEEAESLARRALSVRPEAPEFVLTLGAILARQGRWDAAETQLREAERIIGAMTRVTPSLREKMNQLRIKVEQQTAEISTVSELR